jgi:hypothetical protein
MESGKRWKKLKRITQKMKKFHEIQDGVGCQNMTVSRIWCYEKTGKISKRSVVA